MISAAYNSDVLVCSTAADIAPEEKHSYTLHYLCKSGSCTFVYGINAHPVQAGDCVIISLPMLMESFTPTQDFACRLIAVRNTFLEKSRPRSNYGTKGRLSLYINPVMPLTEEERKRCERDFDDIAYLCAHPEHRFQDEVVSVACQKLFLDFFDFHCRIYGEENIPLQSSALIGRFIDFLKSGTYRTQREISWYASELCVTSKHLSETCKKFTGHNASHWINHFLIIDLKRYLLDKSIPFTEICDMFGFSSPAHFTRFVQNNFGMTPSAFRE